MAWTETETLLSLHEWAKIVGVDYWSLSGVSSPTGRTAPCEAVWYQYPWQKDFLSRETLAEAIAMAEDLLAEQLHYYPAPKYIFDEDVQNPPFNDHRLYGLGATYRGDWKAVPLRWGCFQSGGQRNRAVIDADAAVVLSDVDGDGVKDMFTVTAATTLTDVDEIAIYFAASDRLGEAVGEKWRIRPVKVSISGGTATITGHITLLVQPKLQTIAQPAEQSSSDDTIYVDTVDVYRTYTDDTATTSSPNQGVAIWDVPLSDSPTAPAESVLPVQFGNRLNRAGMPYLFYGLSSTWPYGRQPERFKVHYRAGVPRSGDYMDHQYADIVAKLATALLPNEKCGCEYSHRIIAYWRRPVNDGVEGETGRQFTLEEINNNPFGEPRLGALMAWKRVKHLAQLGIVSV